MESSYEIFDAAIKQVLRKYWNHPLYDDLYQECYMKILDVLNNNTYDPVYNLYGYAYSIARNAVSSYLYHSNKLTTLSTDDLPQVVSLPTNDQNDFSSILQESIIHVMSKYKNILPKDFTVNDALNLLYTQDPDNITLIVLKGSILWYISKGI